MPAILEPVTLAIHLQDIHVVGETIQQCPGEPLRVKHRGSLVEGQVGGHQDGAALVALTANLEEQFRAGGGQRHETQLVDGKQHVPRQLPLEVEQSSVVPVFHEFMDQCGGGGEPTDSPR